MRQVYKNKQGMFHCNLCGLMSPSEKLTINHMNCEHFEYVAKCDTWVACTYCMKSYPYWINHDCLKLTGKCNLCGGKYIFEVSEKKNAQTRKIYRHMRLYHFDLIKVRPILFLLNF